MLLTALAIMVALLFVAFIVGSIDFVRRLRTFDPHFSRDSMSTSVEVL